MSSASSSSSSSLTDKNSALFRSLDHGHHNVTTINEEVFSYASSDLEVKKTTTLAFPVQFERTTVSFAFHTLQGVVQFGVKFKNDRTKKETVLLKSGWCECENNTVSGVFELDHIGVVNFTWDNTVQSWISTKHVNYKIDIKQAIFEYDDSIRSNKALSLLPGAREDKDNLLISLYEMHGGEQEQQEMRALIETHKQTLKDLKKEKKKVEKLKQNKLSELTFLKERISGLFIRSLDSKLLRRIFR